MPRRKPEGGYATVDSSCETFSSSLSGIFSSFSLSSLKLTDYFELFEDSLTLELLLILDDELLSSPLISSE